MSETPRRGPTRRDLLRSGALAGAAAAAAPMAGAGAAAAHGGGTAPAGDLILTNGEIHTMDRRDPVVSVVAIRDGEIVYTGDKESHARKEFTDPPRAIDLRGKTAVPGIIDCHNHIVLMGNRPGYHTPLENAYSVADVQSTIRARTRVAPAGAFVTTIGGFHFNQFEERRLPSLAELDAAAPHHPVYLSIGFTGPSVTNSLGKAFFESVPGPDGPVTVGADGAIAAGQQTGRATLALRRQLTFEDRRRGARDAMRYAVSLGVTTHLDQGAFQAADAPSDGAAHEDNYRMHLPFLSVFGDGDGIVRLRINFLHMDADPASVALGERLRNAFPFFGNDLVRTGGIGEFVAPVPSDPITSGSPGNLRWLEAARKVAQARWRAEVHSLSTTDFKAEIDGFALINAEFPITDLRWVVGHVPSITEDYVDKLKALGGGINVTGFRYFAGTPTAAGPPYRMLADNGIPLGMSSDGMQIAPMNPWVHAYYATTGVNALGVAINGNQLLTRQEAVELYTRANGWFLGGVDEDRLGVLAPGRLGDVAVLNRDYFDRRRVGDADLKKINSVLTVLGGVVVHDAR
ncbi:amidohydrolase family protein [Asanoa siamensis]|uniref:Amidohydrolase n=1 Tax=Asanoa siamensis TaxID=926357 RepID=A0ABQ4CJJ6_9ACTN|nr:amidohydrolase family protein [Asanoa siamensis]GIF71441.1 amidohydrolase [Asanoa siamensis]